MRSDVFDMAALRCEACGCGLAAWEDVYAWDAGGAMQYVCEDCFDSLLFALTRIERAALIRSETAKAEDMLSRV